MKINFLRGVLCILALAVLTAQQSIQAEEPASTEPPAQTLFAYRSSLGARLHDSFFGNSELPIDVPVALVAVDPSALANATVNSHVTFRIIYGLTIKGLAYAYSGTLIEAKVTRIREGKLRVRRGKTEPRVLEIAVPELLKTEPPPAPESLKLTIESSPRSASSRTVKQLIALPLTVPLKALHIAVLVPEYILLGIACSTSSCDL